MPSLPLFLRLRVLFGGFANTSAGFFRDGSAAAEFWVIEAVSNDLKHRRKEAASKMFFYFNLLIIQ